MNKKDKAVKTYTAKIGEQEISISTGELAKQAGGAVLVQIGETVVLGTATMGNPPNPDADWMPLLVDYEEKHYAAGKIKGSRYMKREGRPTDDAILNARLIDRSIRPLFPEDMINDIQVVLTVLSYDGENNPDVPALIAACGALMISNIPWQDPLAAVRVGRVDDKFIINPTTEQIEQGTLDLIVAGTKDRIAMIEAGAEEISENDMLDAFEEAQNALGKIVPILEKLQKKVGKTKAEPVLCQKDEDNLQKMRDLAQPLLAAKLENVTTKNEVGQAERDTYEDIAAGLNDEDKEAISEKTIRAAVHETHAAYFRQQIIEKEWRVDGRALDAVRPLHIRAGILPRTHGTGLFQRGETQVLTTLTLGGPSDALLLESMEQDGKKRYIHYYNFPAFSVGEVRPNRGPGRRDIGHGALAERALLPVLPEKDKWPYTMMLVSEVLESHGSSSMASVCGSSLALMDAGVPIKKPVAGIAMGLVMKDKNNYKILTDIVGIEDEKGDMDFKVAGTTEGITAIQMDINVSGLTRQILSEALEQGKKARLGIIDQMNAVISEPRADLSPYAPRIEVMQIPVDKISDLIGPKGKHINEIIDETGVEIDIEDDGTVSITSNDAEAMIKAKDWVHNLTREIQSGEKFDGKVTRLMDFGAFVELVPGVEGMVHISQFRDERVEKINDVVKVGDVIPVVVIEIDDMGRINLSHKAALSGSSTSSDNEKQPKKPDNSGLDSKPTGPFRGPRPPR